jgi:radical SAM superfamily enzyme YgiQ (UPF0313 family)
MKILLLAMPDASDWLDHIVRLPNLALVSLAAAVPEHEVRVLDLLAVRERIKAVLDRELDDFKPDLVGLSAMTFQYDTLVRMAEYIRGKLPAAHLVAGGYHVTLMYREIAEETPDVPLDFMVRGEGEDTFRELTDSLAGKMDDMSGIAGLSWRGSGGAWHHNPPRPLMNLTTLSLPSRQSRQVHKFHIFNEPVDVAETSRGCPLLCNFCSIRQMYGSTFRRFPVERIIEDLGRIRARGARIIFLSDDNITYDTEHFKSVCEAIIAHGFNNVVYSIQASAYGIAKSPELVALMDRANIRIINLGLESMDPSAIKFMKKATSVAINEEAVRLLKAHNMGINALFIIGFPDDTRDIIMDNFRGLMAMKPDSIYCQIISPYPKTEVREQLLAEGLVENCDDYSKYDGYHCNVRTKYLTREELWKVFTRENIKSWWPQLKGGNFFLKHYFRGYLRCESRMVFTFFRRLLRGKPIEWQLDQ